MWNTKDEDTGEIESELDQLLLEIRVIEESDYQVPVDPDRMFGNLLQHLDASILKKKTTHPSYYSPDGPLFKCEIEHEKTPEEAA